MNVQLIRYTEDALTLCYLAARRCYSSNSINSIDKDVSYPEMAKLVQKCIKDGHMSILEHASFAFAVEGISRCCLVQLTRHRIASFSVMSERWCNMKDACVVIPATIKQNKDALAKFYTALHETLRAYQMLVDVYSVPKEDARYILPQGIETKLIMTMNARELYHFFSLRLCKRAQWEIRQLAEEMLRLCKEVEPDIFALAGKPCDVGKCDKGGCKHKEQEHD